MRAGFGAKLTRRQAVGTAFVSGGVTDGMGRTEARTYVQEELVVLCRARQRTFAPGDALRRFREARREGVRNHAPDVVAHDVHLLRDAQVVGEERVQVSGDGDLAVAVARPGGVAGAAIVGRHDPVPARDEERDHVAELVRGFWVAVDEEKRAPG